jgi:hypothetical protein
MELCLIFALAKLRKATISFGMSVCLSVRMEKLSSHRTGFYEILYLSIFRKSVEKGEASLNLLAPEFYI